MTRKYRLARLIYCRRILLRWWVSRTLGRWLDWRWRGLSWCWHLRQLLIGARKLRQNRAFIIPWVGIGSKRVRFYTLSYKKFRYFYNKAGLLSANSYKGVSIYLVLAEYFLWCTGSYQ